MSNDAADDVPAEDACALAHPKPFRFEVGLLCRRHYHWIDRTLVQVEELYALTGLVLLPGSLGGDGRSGTRVGSPAPGRLAVMAITDRRADTPSGLDSEDDVPDVPGTLYAWARRVRRLRPTTDTLGGVVTQSVRVLRRERFWIAQQTWVDEYADEISSVHRHLASAVGDTMWPVSIGLCPNCGTPLYNTVGHDEVTCRRCRSVWDGVHLARLRLIHERESAGA